MTPRPLVSIGMPVFNGGSQFAESLASIRRQTWEHLDIVISDNASTDGTAEVCLRAAAEDSRVRYIRQQTNIGATGNFETVRSLRRGEFFAWAAHDDLREPAYVERTVSALLANPEAVLSHSWTRIECTDGSSFIDKAYDDAILDPDPLVRMRAFFRCQYNVSIYGMYRSTALDRIGPADDWLEGDRYFLFDAALAGPIVIVPDVLFTYRMVYDVDHYRKLFPFKGDHILARYRRFPRHLRAAGLAATEERRCREELRAILGTMLDDRLSYLISGILAKNSGSRRLGPLLRWSTQYPPALRSRMFWGAVRRVVGGEDGD